MSRERMLIAVGVDHETHVLVSKGAHIEREIEQTGVASDLGLDGLIDDPGLWIVTCSPKYVEDGAGDGYTDYNREVMIQPLSEGEWDHLKACRFGAIKAGWADIVGAAENAEPIQLPFGFEPPFIDPDSDEDQT